MAPLPETVAILPCASRALRFVEARRPTVRLFGGNADGLWRGLNGLVAIPDRADQLLCDEDERRLETSGAMASRADSQRQARGGARGLKVDEVCP